MKPATASAELLIPASRERIWSLLADPQQHHRFDGTGMVGTLASAPPTAVGDVFRMNMTYTDGEHVEHYQSDNHMIAYQPGEIIAWATAWPDEPPLGWTWTYRLSDAAGGTLVSLTYDWTDAPQENRRRFGAPLTDRDGLAASLNQLAKECATP